MLDEKYDYSIDKSNEYSQYRDYIDDLRKSLSFQGDLAFSEVTSSFTRIRPHFYGPLHRNSARFLALTAHRNAGKTFGSIQKELAMAVAYPGAKILIAGPTFKRVKSLFQPFIDYHSEYWKVRNLGKVKQDKSNGSWELDFGDGPPRYIKLGSYAEEDSLRGEHCHRILLTEGGYLSDYVLNGVIKGLMYSNSSLTIEGTPSGHNVFYDRFMRGYDQNEPWTCFKLPASKSGILSDEFLEQAKKELGDALYDQEYECNFDVAIATNHIYAQLIYDIREKNQVNDRITQDCNYPIYLACDLGYTDYFSSMIFQYINGKIYFLDFYLGNKNHVSVHLNNIRAKGYSIATAFLPHDGANKSGNADFTYQEIFSNYGYNVIVLKNDSPLQVQLKHCQLAFPNTYWNEDKCSPALEALQRARVKVGKEFNNPLFNSPVHESPFCDVAACFRYCVGATKYICDSALDTDLFYTPKSKYDRYF
jgi:hypothetical protein